MDEKLAQSFRPAALRSFFFFYNFFFQLGKTSQTRIPPCFVPLLYCSSLKGDSSASRVQNVLWREWRDLGRCGVLSQQLAAAAEKLRIDTGLLAWVGQVFAVGDRLVFLMAEHIYPALVKHSPCKEANWLAPRSVAVIAGLSWPEFRRRSQLESSNS